MKNPTTIAVDLSKSVFEVAVEREGRICQRKRLSRGQTIAFLSQVPKATAHRHPTRSLTGIAPTTENL